MLLFGKGFDTWSLGSISTPIRHMSRKVPKSMSAHLIGQLSATRKEQLDEMETIANSLFQYLTPQESPVCVSELTVNAVVSAGRIMVKRFMWPAGNLDLWSLPISFQSPRPFSLRFTQNGLGGQQYPFPTMVSWRVASTNVVYPFATPHRLYLGAPISLGLKTSVQPGGVQVVAGSMLSMVRFLAKH